MERKRSAGIIEVAEVPQSQQSSTRRSSRNTGPSVLDMSDVSTTSATSVPSSAGGTLKEQELQRRILAMESKLKDVDLLIKDQMPQQKSEAPPFQEMQEELDEMQRYRESLQARADNLEKILLKERAEHQASLEAYSNSMNKSIDAMNNSVEKSVADSTALMKARMVEAENLIRKLVNQLNHTYSKAPNHEVSAEAPQLVSSMAQLLEEHQQLVQANQNLLAWRTDFAGVGAVPIPTWEAIPLPQNYVEAPMLLSKVDGGLSPRYRSPAPEGSPTGYRSPVPEGSPTGYRSPGVGYRSPGVVQGSPVHSSPSARSPNHPEKPGRRPSGSPGARSPSPRSSPRISPVNSTSQLPVNDVSPSPRGLRVHPPREELAGSPGMRFQAEV